ncbi:hypothetical protein LXL04_026511 [Taraxacum kok-saghyz]
MLAYHLRTYNPANINLNSETMQWIVILMIAIDYSVCSVRISEIRASTDGFEEAEAASWLLPNPNLNKMSDVSENDNLKVTESESKTKRLSSRVLRLGERVTRRWRAEKLTSESNVAADRFPSGDLGFYFAQVVRIVRLCEKVKSGDGGSSLPRLRGVHF